MNLDICVLIPNPFFSEYGPIILDKSEQRPKNFAPTQEWNLFRQHRCMLLAGFQNHKGSYQWRWLAMIMMIPAKNIKKVSKFLTGFHRWSAPWGRPHFGQSIWPPVGGGGKIPWEGSLSCISNIEFALICFKHLHGNHGLGRAQCNWVKRSKLGWTLCFVNLIWIINTRSLPRQTVPAIRQSIVNAGTLLKPQQFNV